MLEATLAAEGFLDFEDAVLHEAARQADADALVTRNESDFRAAILAVYEPRDAQYRPSPPCRPTGRVTLPINSVSEPSPLVNIEF